MSTEPNGAPTGEAITTHINNEKQPENSSEAKPAANTSKKEKKEKTNANTDPNAPKLSGAELKAKAKAEKAARRAQAKDSKAAAAVSSKVEALGPAVGEVKSRAKGKTDSSQQSGQNKAAPIKGAQPAASQELKNVIPECFSHLSMARRIPMTEADKDVHPAVLALGQQMSTFTITESIARLEATLKAFKKVIDSYTTPHGHTLARHFTPHVLNTQVEYLTACRPMCFSMGNAIRWLKLQVSKVDVDLSEDEAKKLLCERIDSFIRERITLADWVITKAISERIEDGDVILTFGRNSLVEKGLYQAQTLGKEFSVFVVDDPFERGGQLLAKRLQARGVIVSYSPDFGGLRSHLSSATKILLGAEAMFSNGSLYASVGTSDIALAAKELEKPVLALCETINLTERMSTDSLTYNEVDPERSSADSFRLLFDVTLDQYIDSVVTELGTVLPTSVPDLLRKLEEFN